MKLNMKEKKILYAYGCPSHHNTVTRLKWLTALTVDPEAKSQMLHLARKIGDRGRGKVVRSLLPSSADGDGRIPPD